MASHVHEGWSVCVRLYIPPDDDGRRNRQVVQTGYVCAELLSITERLFKPAAPHECFRFAGAALHAGTRSVSLVLFAE